MIDFLKKIYPKAVTLRKELIVVALGLTLVIAGLLILNINRSSQPIQPTDTSQHANLRTATPEDVHNLQRQAEEKTVPPPSQGALNTKSTAAQPIQTPSPTEDPLLKAQQAPISQNQINQNSTDSAVASSANAMNTSSNPMGSNDPNQQGAKKAFLKENAVSEADTLQESLKNPISPYEVKAGTIIPGILITGINSDLPGQIVGQVRSNVYDTIEGRSILIPQGAKLTGVYDSQIVYGQERVLVVWKRIIFPNGQSINLEGMPGVDLSGYAGFHDQVNNHYGKLFGSVLLMSLMSAGAQLSQPQQTQNPFAAPTVNQMLAQSLGTQIASVGTQIASKNLAIQPTLDIRPGYLFNIMVTKDMVFPSAYSPANPLE